jgi:hypothetical protein
MKILPSLLWGAGLAATVGLGAFLWTRSAATRGANGANADRLDDGTELRVPRHAGINLDGDTDDWGSAGARTGWFVTASGGEAHPQSSVRLVWGDGYLYLVLYAADEDIRVGKAGPDGPLWLEDAFQLVFSSGDLERRIDVDPNGVLTDGIRLGNGPVDYTWQSGAHVSRELDGTVNDPSDADEEWVIEMAIPFESLGLEGRPGERIGFIAKRCDRPKTGPRVCGSSGQRSLVLQ